MAFKVGNFGSGNAIDAKKAAIEAAKQKALPSGEQPQQALVKWLSPAEVSDRIRIVFDDSGSMAGQIENAKKGVVEFFRNCIPNQTACALHFMNTTSFPTELQTNLMKLGADVEEYYLKSGGTPFFNTIMRALKATPKLTRMVVFTDGSPTDVLEAEKEETSSLVGYYSFNSQQGWISSADVVIKHTKELGNIPVDTIFFGPVTTYTEKPRELLKYLADKTGGFFMVFDPAKVNFRTAFKYLAPVNRLMLTSGSFRASLEAGEVK